MCNGIILYTCHRKKIVFNQVSVSAKLGELPQRECFDWTIHIADVQ